jgi:predicted O-methyltransferase YrrM
MPHNLFASVDRYLSEHLVPPDPVLDSALEDSSAAGLPAIQVSPMQGKLLMLMARMIGARRILEFGTLGGYSTIWLARGMPADSRLVTLEADAKHADVARANFRRAALDQMIDLRLGPALETVSRLASEKAAPFDLTFIDADKVNTLHYFQWALKLSHPGSVIIVDNVVREGEVANPATTDPNVLAMRRFFEHLSAESRVTATALQTVGAKSHDGFAIALVL